MLLFSSRGVRQLYCLTIASVRNASHDYGTAPYSRMYVYVPRTPCQPKIPPVEHVIPCFWGGYNSDPHPTIVTIFPTVAASRKEKI